MMNLKYFIVVSVLTFITESSAAPGVLTLIQRNVVGAPVVHQRTEWDFDPEEGKERQVRFEALNGHLGKDLIARLGMGMSFKGPWGLKTSNQPKPDLKYNN